MTRDEFIKRYHNYSTQSKTAAMTEAMLVNVEGITDGKAVAVRFGDLGYSLMLQDTLEYLVGQKLENREVINEELESTGPSICGHWH